jgi:hypothetical protein
MEVIIFVNKEYKYKIINTNNMNSEYYLFCRKKYCEILSNLDNIVEAYDNIIDCIEKNEKFNSEYIEKSKERNFFVKNREYIIEKKKKCDDYINDLCCHEFEEDMIDITPEKSMKITYCKICEYTK